MKNLLYISHRIPFPPNKGDRIRTFNEIRYLSRFFTIDLISIADNPSATRFTPNLEKYCRQVHIFPIHPNVSKLKGVQCLLSGRAITQGYFFSTRARDKAAELLQKNDYSTVFCFSSPSAEYVFENLSHINRESTRLIMDFCDVDSDKWQQYAMRSSFPMKQIYRAEAARLLEYEKKISTAFDVSVFVSENEAALFRQKVPGAKKVLPVSNGVDFAYFSNTNPKKDKNTSPTILFTGAMDYYANIDGVTWFCKKIFPLIKQQVPAARFMIVGSNPTTAIKELSRMEGVTVTGYVADIRPYYQAADVSAIPLRIARGIQNKVLEAMAMALPVVCTSTALGGITATPGKDLIQADDAKTFADAVMCLITDRAMARKIAESAVKTVKTHYSWQNRLAELNPCLGIPCS